MNILNDIPELVNADIISSDTANKIRAYYEQKNPKSPKRLIILFGILGSILVGLGMILIIAHNWEEFSRPLKTFFAFFPMVAGQIICGYTLISKNENVAWREASAAFLFFAVGACISLVSQIYNVPGDLPTFLMTWMLLCLPLMYLMKSSVASLLYLTGITYYGIESSYFSYDYAETYTYWILLFCALPNYYLLFRRKRGLIHLLIHHWVICLSVIIMLGSLASTTEELILIAYMSLFGLFYIIGNVAPFSSERLRNNPYLFFGALGTIILLLILSFDFFWKHLRNKQFEFAEVIRSAEFISSVFISLIALGMLLWERKNLKRITLRLINFVFLLFIITFIIGLSSLISVFLINFFVFAIGILTIREGAKLDHLGVLNFGLLIITALFICRFFDTDLSFVTRGILFLSVGVGFFLSNIWVLKKRREK